jgi:hypothetical protein
METEQKRAALLNKVIEKRAADAKGARAKFWENYHLWPSDTPTHVFLALAVLQVGKVMHGEAWTGHEPRVSSRAAHQSFEKAKLLGRLPTDAAGQARVAGIMAAVDRFDAVMKAIATRCARGWLLSASLPTTPGKGPAVDLAPLAATVWRPKTPEDIEDHFRLCQFSEFTRDRFARGRLVPAPARWIYLEKVGLERALGELKPATPATTGGAGYIGAGYNDKDLLAEMKRLLDGGTASSPADAANQVVSGAGGLGAPESRARRLQRKFIKENRTPNNS